jgi:hypothetical protein
MRKKKVIEILKTFEQQEEPPSQKTPGNFGEQFDNFIEKP